MLLFKAVCAVLLKIFACTTFFVCITSLAAPIPWRDVPFTLVTKGMRLDNVFHELGAQNNLSVVVSRRVTDIYAGALRQMPPAQVLARLAHAYGLSWYYNGQALHVYRADEVGYQMLTPTFLKVDTLLAHLKHRNEPYCRAEILSQANALEIFGVPACLERFNQVAKQLDAQIQTAEKNEEEIESFPLRYASAGDTNYRYRQQEVIIPGVVSMLREIAQGKTFSLQSNKDSPQTDSTLPVFAADVRQNAVLVRDRKINMPIYAALIKQVDVKQPLIEVSVAIIDVDVGDLDALGIDWSVSAKIGGGKVSFNQSTGLDSSNFSTIIADTQSFMVRLNALEQHSKAKVLSRPSVVTLNNVQAILDRNITFYTKIMAENVARLESISAGSLMRVTPRLIQEGQQQRVMLTLNIEDGRQISAMSERESLPQVQNSEIATQASLLAGQSLLLGGFVREEQTHNERKIPLLADIPILGQFFQSSNQINRSVVRLFLIKAEPLSLVTEALEK